MTRLLNPTRYIRILMLAVILAAISPSALARKKVAIPIVLEEQLGHHWASQIMHKTVNIPKQGQLYAGKCALFLEGKEIPMQLDNIHCFSDGSIKQADIWFRTDLPAGGKKALELRSVRRPKAVKTDVYVETRNDFIEIGNRITAVRAPIAGKNTSSGPIMGIKLANGKWTGGSRFSAQEKLDFPQTPGLIQDLPNEPAGKLQGYTTEVLANGPIFYRYRINYRFANDGTYGITFTVRSDDPVIYVDETYKRAGALTIDLDGYRPKRAWYKSNRMHKGKAIELAYEGARQFAIHLGWDGYFTDVAPAYIFTGADEKQCLALIGTDADWLPFPYNQALHLWTKPEGLAIKASLQNGHRHWGIFIGREDQFKDPVNEFYPWWWQNICINMDREDPIFLLVRDDTSRKGSASAVHWWVMSKDVQPGGYESVGVVPPKGFKDEDWIKKLGQNWKDAPKLKGQTHRFQTHFNVDLDMFIASPANPKIVTDAVGFKPRQPYCVNRKMCEYQQLIRIEQGEGKHYLTLLSPSEKNEKARSYRTIADGYGVVADTGNQQNRLFLAPKKVSYQDDVVKFDGKAGFARVGDGDMIRLMVIDGTIESEGFRLSSTTGKAGLFFDGKQVRIYGAAQSQLEFLLPENAKNIPVKMIYCE